MENVRSIEYQKREITAFDIRLPNSIEGFRFFPEHLGIDFATSFLGNGLCKTHNRFNQ
jgi:hypothetical protein